MTRPSDTPLAVVTGASSGIGLATAIGLAARGRAVVAVGRDRERLARARSRIEAAGAAPVRIELADLERPPEVAALVERLAALDAPIDLLVNNAGAVFFRTERTPEGLERTLALNVLAPFELTRRLLPHLRRGRPGRVVMVASQAQAYGTLDPDHPAGPTGAGGWGAYSRSKLALIILTREFARREGPEGVRFFAVHPGLVATRFAANNSGAIGWFVNAMVHIAGISSQRAARRILELTDANGQAYPSGSYLVRSRPRAIDRDLATPDAGARLWRACEDLLGGLSGPSPSSPEAGARPPGRRPGS